MPEPIRTKASLPTNTLAILFTDIEGSTVLWADGVRLILAFFVGLVGVSAWAGNPGLAKTLDAKLAVECAGSYALAEDQIIDIGPMGEMGGDLVFLNSKTLREGHLRQISEREFVAGPSVGIDEPIAIRVTFLRDHRGRINAIRWNGDGIHNRVARRIAAHKTESIEIRNGEVVLRGELLVPTTHGRHPAILLAHGSGPATRNVGMWNVFFVRLGMAVLSLDKRGAGESTGDFRAASMDDLASDWLAGVTFLKSRSDIDPRRIGVHGSSQGGWTAPLMAARSSDVAFVIVRAGSGSNVADTMLHEIEWSARESGMREDDISEGMIAARAAMGMIARGVSTPDYDAAMSPYRSRPSWSDVFWVIDETLRGQNWIRLNAAYDPIDSIYRIHVPILWFLADKDHNVPTEVSASRLRQAFSAAGNRDAMVIILANAGHGFLSTPTGNNNEFAEQSHYTPGYWNTMERWLRARGFTRRRQSRFMGRRLRARSKSSSHGKAILIAMRQMAFVRFGSPQIKSRA
jgi:dienelactone hydrolase